MNNSKLTKVEGGYKLVVDYFVSDKVIKQMIKDYSDSDVTKEEQMKYVLDELENGFCLMGDEENKVWLNEDEMFNS